MAGNQSAPSGENDQARLFVWVKGLEAKMNILLREVDLLKNDLLKKHTDLRREVKTVSEDLLQTRREQEHTLQKMDLIIKELKQTAGMDDVLTLKKYLDLWNPLHFTTQVDVERLIEQKLQENSSLPEDAEQTHKKEKHLPFV